MKTIDISELLSKKRLFWAILTVGLILDIGSKIWAQSAIQPTGWSVGQPTPTHPLIDGVFALKWAGNLGAAFSMLHGKVALLTIFGLIALAGILFYVYKTPARHPQMLTALGLIGAGAIGNIYDRIALGWVRDFLYFDFDLPFYKSVGFIPQRYPVFNVADIWILFGALLLVFAARKLDREAAAERAKAPGKTKPAKA